MYYLSISQIFYINTLPNIKLACFNLLYLSDLFVSSVLQWWVPWGPCIPVLAPKCPKKIGLGLSRQNHNLRRKYTVEFTKYNLIGMNMLNPLILNKQIFYLKVYLRGNIAKAVVCLILKLWKNTHHYCTESTDPGVGIYNCHLCRKCYDLVRQHIWPCKHPCNSFRDKHNIYGCSGQ